MDTTHYYRIFIGYPSFFGASFGTTVDTSYIGLVRPFKLSSEDRADLEAHLNVATTRSFFINQLQVGDIVVCTEGNEYSRIGRITADSPFLDPESMYSQIRCVQWFSESVRQSFMNASLRRDIESSDAVKDISEHSELIESILKDNRGQWSNPVSIPQRQRRRIAKPDSPIRQTFTYLVPLLGCLGLVVIISLIITLSTIFFPAIGLPADSINVVFVVIFIIIFGLILWFGYNGRGRDDSGVDDGGGGE